MRSKVLQSIAQGAATFCGAHDIQIHVVDGTVLRCVAEHGNLSVSAGHEALPVSGDLVAGRAVLAKKTIHLGDIAGPSRRKRSRRAESRYHSILVDCNIDIRSII